jgi:hypothetical protein
VRKNLSVSNGVDTAIKAVKAREGGRRISYSKALNYLVALGVDRYNHLFKAEIPAPKFDFDKYHRK